MSKKSETSPSIAESDLQSLTELTSIIAATQDALSDDMVSRLSGALSEGLALLDRLTRNEGLIRLLHSLDHPDNQVLLIALSKALTTTSQELSESQPAKGGIGGLLKIVSEPGTSEGIRILSSLSKHLSDGVRNDQTR